MATLLYMFIKREYTILSKDFKRIIKYNTDISFKFILLNLYCYRSYVEEKRRQRLYIIYIGIEFNSEVQNTLPDREYAKPSTCKFIAI